MSSTHVLHVPRSDGNSSEDYVLICVTSKSSSTLDLQIEGTEGETPYTEIFNRSQIVSSIAPNSHLSADEYTHLLQRLLLQDASVPLPSTVAHPSLTAHLATSPPSLQLSLRSSTSGINQRFGTLVLPAVADHEIDTIAWTSSAAVRGDALATENEALGAKIEVQAQMIGKLQEQLTELVREKQETERRILSGCAALLNEKKRKVRDLERVLAGAKIDSTKATAVKAARGSSAIKEDIQGARMAGPSRPGKRKTDKEDVMDCSASDSPTSASSPSSASSSAGFEMAAPRQASPDRDAEENEYTREAIGEIETNDEPTRQSRSDEGEPGKTSRSEVGASEQVTLGQHQMPPKRELPFSQRKGRDEILETTSGESGEMVSHIVDDETESDDDEL